jgi:ATP-dependent protease HslVU (ClpYQ) peptidase subunit
MRSISRVINLLTEIEQICDKSNYDLIKKINNCVTILKKDWLNPDSIYLKQNGTIIIID